MNNMREEGCGKVAPAIDTNVVIKFYNHNPQDMLFQDNSQPPQGARLLFVERQRAHVEWSKNDKTRNQSILNNVQRKVVWLAVRHLNPNYTLSS